MQLKIISAGAGSGKTHRLTTEMVELLASGEVRATGIIATTFTNKAAVELQERVRVRLLEEGLTREANDLANALIGTVHGLGVKLLKRFAFEAGVSPQVDILAEDDQQVMFNQSLAMVLTNERVEEMERLSNRLGLNKSDRFSSDWRRILKEITEVARANDFSFEALEKSKQLSFQSFCDFLTANDEEPVSAATTINRLPTADAWNEELGRQIEEAVSRLENNGDSTKKTADAVKNLKELRKELELREELFWFQWVKLAKTDVGVKSRDDLQPLVDFCNLHLFNPAFLDDIRAFIFNIFDITKDAIHEYDSYKKHRGLIDYTDMEVLVRLLLDNEKVQEVLREELDLLMVDEFQDTSPLQLEIFLKLSRFARHSIWVGDPKQSIYGFRGAEPALMDAIVQSQGGLRSENILEKSWRSREDIVYAVNAIFTKAFSNLPAEQVALKPVRHKNGEPAEMTDSLHHWHFRYDGEGRKPGKEWLNHCIAITLRTFLERGVFILPKGEKTYRRALPGDVVVLCRSNNDCKEMAEALHRAGLRVAISRAGLLSTAEAKLILACLKFILNKHDSLSIAEILLLAGGLNTEEIIEDRLDYLEKHENGEREFNWGENNSFVQRLNFLRHQVVELSGTEILTLLLEELDLRRIIVSWGNVEQRFANVDVLCGLATKYEENCSRLHSAASLGGFLLWLNDLEKNGLDSQGSGESPEAVNVLTYHRSKGLEYPIVICHNLENTLRGDVWGVSIVPEKDEVDLDNLLGNRWLRFWVNPYADQFRNTILEERINASPVKAAKLREALEEEARLLYVGTTRARDYLIFPTREKPTIWLNRVCNGGNEEHPALDPGSSESHWEWDGKYLYIQTESFHFPNDFAHAEPPQEEIWFVDERAGKAFFAPFNLKVSDGHDNGEQLKMTLREEAYASAPALPDVPEKHAAVKALQAFLSADNTDYPLAERIQIANDLLFRYEAESLIIPDRFVDVSNAFFGWLRDNFQFTRILRRYPVRLPTEGREFETVIDFLLETEKGFVIINNSSFTGDSKGRAKRAAENAATLQWCKAAIRQIFGMVSVGTWIHFGSEARLMEIKISEVESLTTNLPV